MDKLTIDREKILKAIQDVVQSDVDENGAICTTFVLITEWMATDGQYYSLVVTDENSPPWRHEGLVHYALANEIYGIEEEEE